MGQGDVWDGGFDNGDDGHFLSSLSSGTLTVTGTGEVLVTGVPPFQPPHDYGAGIYGQKSLAYVDNLGTVESSAVSQAGGDLGIGIDLTAGGIQSSGNSTIELGGPGITISALQYANVVLNSPTQNSLLVTSTGDVSVHETVYEPTGITYVPAVYGVDHAWSVVNLGTIDSNSFLEDSQLNSTVALGVGIRLVSGGVIVNGSTSETAALIDGSQEGVVLTGSVNSTLFNYGTVIASETLGASTFAGGTGVLLVTDGTVINGSAADTAALISGGAGGGVHSFDDLDVQNFGTIAATNFGGIVFEGSGGSITNGSSQDSHALIQDSGAYGVVLYGTSYLRNFGTIMGGGSRGPSAYAVIERGASSEVINQGTIIGFAGISMSSGNFVNDGVVDGTGGTAVVFSGTGRTLVVDPGASFIGKVDVGGGDVLELGAGLQDGTLTGLGGSITGATTIEFGALSRWTIAGNTAGLAAHQTIAGFAPGDKIILDGFHETGASYVSGVGLELAGSAGTSATLDITGRFASSDFRLHYASGSSTITLDSSAPCFVAGTRILGVRGEIAVENLRVGDRLINVNGEDRKIIWIGRRRMDLARHKAPGRVLPVCIAAGALADGVPCRDLLVSPDHALLLEGCLVPAKALLNDLNVVQVKRPWVDYYHVELSAHDIIFAEGTVVESFLETGNRWAFDNGDGAVALHPELGQMRREAESCAPFVESGPVVARALARLAGRGLRRLEQVRSAF